MTINDKLNKLKREYEMRARQEAVDGYVNTVERLEPDIHPIDASAFYASSAISLRRMADAAEQQTAAIVEHLTRLRERD